MQLQMSLNGQFCSQTRTISLTCFLFNPFIAICLPYLTLIPVPGTQILKFLAPFFGSSFWLPFLTQVPSLAPFPPLIPLWLLFSSPKPALSLSCCLRTYQSHPNTIRNTLSATSSIQDTLSILQVLSSTLHLRCSLTVVNTLSASFSISGILSVIGTHTDTSSHHHPTMISTLSDLFLHLQCFLTVVSALSCTSSLVRTHYSWQLLQAPFIQPPHSFLEFSLHHNYVIIHDLQFKLKLEQATNNLLKFQLANSNDMVAGAYKACRFE